MSRKQRGGDIGASEGSSRRQTPWKIGEDLIVDNYLTGFNGHEVKECMMIIKTAAPDKLPPATKVIWLYCGTLDEVRLRAKLDQ